MPARKYSDEVEAYLAGAILSNLGKHKRAYARAEIAAALPNNPLKSQAQISHACWRTGVVTGNYNRRNGHSGRQIDRWFKWYVSGGPNISYRHVAEHFGITSAVVLHAFQKRFPGQGKPRSRAGMFRRRKNGWTNDDVTHAIDLVEKKQYTISAAAKEVGCPKWMVSKHRRVIGLPPISMSEARRRVLGLSSITEEMRNGWRKRYQQRADIALEDLADEFGVSSTTIRNDMVAHGISIRPAGVTKKAKFASGKLSHTPSKQQTGVALEKSFD